MTRPMRASELIKLEKDAPDFRQGDWWATFKEARLFLARGFAQAMTDLELNTIDPLVAIEAQAARTLDDTEWKKQLPSKHWGDCARPQFRLAANEKPMLLPKAAIAIQALQLYADGLGVEFDAFEAVDLFPAAYRAESWSEDAHEKHKAEQSAEYLAFVAGAEDLKQDHPELLLHDMAKGAHATFGLVELARTTFKSVKIRTAVAQRPGQRGVAPASDWVKPYAG